MQPDYQKVDSRVTTRGVETLITHRWSPRAYSDKAIDAADLACIFEAARLAPSCYNEQPWRFFTSTPGTYDRFLDLLVEGNQSWANTAPLIGFVVAQTQFERNGKANFHARFDAGAAWMSLALQARALGIYAHGMGGIEFDRIYDYLKLNREQYEVICGFTLGYLDSGGDEELSERKPLGSIWMQVE